MKEKRNRREFLSQVMALSGLCVLPGVSKPENLRLTALPQIEKKKFELNYLLATCLYGYMDLHTILPEIKKTGATQIDIWPKIHGNQREQLDDMGEENIKQLLKEHNVELGCITQYKLGPYNLTQEMGLAAKLGCKLIVTGTEITDGPSGLSGQELKNTIKAFIERMKPHTSKAEEKGITIAIENHSGKLLDSFDAIKYFCEFSKSESLKLALAPPHLPQKENEIASLIRCLGKDAFALFYAWELGMGFKDVNPTREEDLMQLPGRGKLDFKPIVAALHDINYQGLTEIFMHPTPRGIPIAETTSEITKEIIDRQKYLNGLH